jgi:hypothetical protein
MPNHYVGEFTAHHWDLGLFRVRPSLHGPTVNALILYRVCRGLAFDDVPTAALTSLPVR